MILFGSNRSGTEKNMDRLPIRCRWKNKYLTESKLQIYKSIVRTVMTYGFIIPYIMKPYGILYYVDTTRKK